ncbi:MAG TPA: pilus assembly protein TadG-related protein [Roseovarius sp.]|nr:pilus assembly protein TadG-related protein [Roseovarius sp.]
MKHVLQPRAAVANAIATTFRKVTGVCADRTRRFRADQSGAMVGLALFIFIFMLAVAGLGIDLMRHEMKRTHLQATLDSAVLAAAGTKIKNGSGNPENDLKQVIKDYFEAAQIGDYLQDFNDDDIKIGDGKTEALASAKLEMDTYLMRLSGVDTLTAWGTTQAAILAETLEIVLVLDVSGSMEGKRLTELAKAAKKFVTTVLDNSTGIVSFSVVPFNSNVVPPREIYDNLTVDQRHSYSTCLVFQDDDFKNTAIDPNEHYAQKVFTSMDHSGWHEVGFGEVGREKEPGENVGHRMDTSYNRSCHNDERFEILPYATTEGAVHKKIELLTAAGGTSGDMGMKWAAALLDPAFRPVVNEMGKLRIKYDADGNIMRDSDGNAQTYSQISTDLLGLPKDYPSKNDSGQTNNNKIIVMMGDGSNGWEVSLKDPANILSNPEYPSDVGWDYRGPGSTLHRVRYYETEFKIARLVRSNGQIVQSSNDPSVCGETVYQYWWGYRYYYGEWECEYEVTENEKTGYYFYASSKSNKYYDPDRDAYFASRDAAFPYLVKDENGQEIDVQLDWEEAWGLVTPWRYAQITGDWQPYDQYNPNSNSTLTGDDKDSRMTDICGKAKEKGVIIYTIAFEMGEADGSNASALSSCASSSENSFAASLDGSVSGIDGTARTIEEVFEVIAASVKKLSLRQ